MSVNTIVAFVVGVAVGAVAALFLAPKSGEELRAQLVSEAREEQERIKKEYDRALNEVHDRIDKLNKDVQTKAE